MTLPTFTANTAALAEDVTSIVTHLQGASGNTEAWHFRSSTSNNFLITLSDAAGARKFSIRDSALAEVFSVDSDGNVTLSGAITTGTFTFPTSATPTPTTEGQASWDTDDNLIAVGDSAATKIIIPTPTTTAGDIEYASGARAHSRLAIGTAGQVLQVNAGATAPEWGGGSVVAAIQGYVESSGYKGGFWLGGSNNNFGAGTSFAVTTAGLGSIILFAETTSGDLFGTSVNPGSWTHKTGATSGQDVGMFGPTWLAANDWTVEWRGLIPSAASQTMLIGAKTTYGQFADENGIIAFRVSGTGNVIGVCDSAGTETTRDTSATGVTELTLRIEVRSGGTIVRFYKNNVQVGADVTTNIPAGALVTCAGVVNSTTADKPMYTYDFAGWREIG